MKVAIIGTVGVPACYGGFETLAENLIGKHCASDIEYTVFCSSIDIKTKLKNYKNAKLKYIPFKANGVQSILYDLISLIRVIRKYDIILYLGASIPILNIYKYLCKGKIIINIDGLSQFRDKYSSFQKKYLSFIKNNEITKADAIIADNQGIKDYVTQNYNLNSNLIAYGGDQVLINVPDLEQNSIINKFGLCPKNYAITVCRIEPENNCHLILEAFNRTNKPLIFIGNWNNSEYGQQLKSKYQDCKNIIIHNPIYDLNTLYALRNNASIYIHGHSVGGTNPSLVEAMFFGVPIFCFDVIYNRATTFENAAYFKNIEDLVSLIENNNVSGSELQKVAFKHYKWETIVKKYENVYRCVLNQK